MTAAPLSGMRVIDWTHVLAGPACAYHLGLLGAEVIKVERPERGDAMRHRGGTDPVRAADGMSTAYLTQAAGKRSVEIDLASADGLLAMHTLLAGADVLVENHRPSTLRRLKLDDETLAERHPHLVHCAMTGYGRGHALEDAPAYDVNIQAASGLMSLTGTEESGPTRVGAPVIDYATALAASMGVCAALLDRERTGRGGLVDVSMLDTAFSLMSSTIVDHALTGHEPRRRGNGANSRSPSAGTFDCAMGQIALGVNEESQFARFAQALDRDEWLSDPRFHDATARETHRRNLAIEIETALAQRDAAAWERLLLDAGVPAALVRTLPEAVEASVEAGRPFLTTVDGSAAPHLPIRLRGIRPPSRKAETLGLSNGVFEEG